MCIASFFLFNESKRHMVEEGEKASILTPPPPLLFFCLLMVHEGTLQCLASDWQFLSRRHHQCCSF